MNEKELYHFGTKGMKWGVWNSDTKAKYLSRTVKQGKDKPNISPAESITKNAKNINESVSNVANDTRTFTNRAKYNKARQEAASMSEEELRKVINRKNLEKQYAQAVSETDSKAAIFVESVLQTTGNLLAISVSAATLATLLYNLDK